ncbi:MAG: HAD-IA family hydrolase [Lachnospiraceae bacterium]|nr:HAD-IA family hydrolase [Lachnospiraceae bacterium]
MSFDAVIFDLDGTLLNTIEDIADAVNAAMLSLGLECVSVEQAMARVGNGFKVLLERCIPDELRTDALLAKAYDKFVESYEKCYANRTAAYEGIKELVRELSARHIKMAVNTNKRNDYANRLIEMHFEDEQDRQQMTDSCASEVPSVQQTGCSTDGQSVQQTGCSTDGQSGLKTAGQRVFVKVLGEGTGYPRKPDPAGALYLADLMGVSPERTVYIGDSQTDAATGKNAGMTFIGVCWGFRSRQVLEECGADYIVETPQEILNIITG